MQIRNLNILEMNKNGTTLWWPASDPDPERSFYNGDYSRSNMMDRCRRLITSTTWNDQGVNFPRFKTRHDHGWQDWYEEMIEARTKVPRSTPT